MVTNCIFIKYSRDQCRSYSQFGVFPQVNPKAGNSSLLELCFATSVISLLEILNVEHLPRENKYRLKHQIKDEKALKGEALCVLGKDIRVHRFRVCQPVHSWVSSNM